MFLLSSSLIIFLSWTCRWDELCFKDYSFKEFMNGPLKPQKPLPSQPIKTSLSDWRSSLGHPLYRVLCHVVSKFCLSISNFKQVHCDACCCNKPHKIIPFDMSFLHSSRPFQLILSVVWDLI